MLSREFPKETMNFSRTIDVTHALSPTISIVFRISTALAAGGKMKRKTYKLPIPNIKPNPIFFLRPNCSVFNSLIGNTTITKSSRMLAAAPA